MSEEEVDPSAGEQSAEAAPADWGAAMAEQQESEARQVADSAQAGDSDPEPAEFDKLESSAAEGSAGSNMDMILDIPVTIALEIGRTKISIRNLLHLNQGSVVELERLAGEPLDVLVNGTLIAHGEVVMVNEKFGIRLTDVISPGERVRNLQ